MFLVDHLHLHLISDAVQDLFFVTYNVYSVYYRCKENMKEQWRDLKARKNDIFSIFIFRIIDWVSFVNMHKHHQWTFVQEIFDRHSTDVNFSYTSAMNTLKNVCQKLHKGILLHVSFPFSRTSSKRFVVMYDYFFVFICILFECLWTN